MMNTSFEREDNRKIEVNPATQETYPKSSIETLRLIC